MATEKHPTRGTPPSPKVPAPTSDCKKSEDPSQLEEAKRIQADALRALQEKRWPDALDAFRRVYAILCRDVSLFHVAVALDHVGEIDESVELMSRYEQVTTSEIGKRRARAYSVCLRSPNRAAGKVDCLEEQTVH